MIINQSSFDYVMTCHSHFDREAGCYKKNHWDFAINEREAPMYKCPICTLTHVLTIRCIPHIQTCIVYVVV